MAAVENEPRPGISKKDTSKDEEQKTIQEDSNTLNLDNKIQESSAFAIDDDDNDNDKDSTGRPVSSAQQHKPETTVPDHSDTLHKTSPNSSENDETLQQDSAVRDEQSSSESLPNSSKPIMTNALPGTTKERFLIPNAEEVKAILRDFIMSARERERGYNLD